MAGGWIRILNANNKLHKQPTTSNTTTELGSIGTGNTDTAMTTPVYNKYNTGIPDSSRPPPNTNKDQPPLPPSGSSSKRKSSFRSKVSNVRSKSTPAFIPPGLNGIRTEPSTGRVQAGWDLLAPQRKTGQQVTGHLTAIPSGKRSSPDLLNVHQPASWVASSTGVGPRTSYPPPPQDSRQKPSTSGGGETSRQVAGSSRSRRIFILMMGATGVGKSSFLKAFGGDAFKAVKSGHGLRSETVEPQEWVYPYKGYSLTLVDTPGFSDTDRSDTQILRSIVDWLDYFQKRGHRINGIIYVQRITDNRMTGSAIQNIRMFDALCGATAMRNAMLCTTFWDAVDPTIGEGREAELRAEYWKRLINQGAIVQRHDNTTLSAQNIIDYFISLPGTTLQIQNELLANGGVLQDTTAGRIVQTELEKLEADFHRQVAELQQDAEEAHREKDEDMLAMITEERARTEKQIQALQVQKKQLVSGLRRAGSLQSAPKARGQTVDPSHFPATGPHQTARTPAPVPTTVRPAQTSTPTTESFYF